MDKPENLLRTHRKRVVSVLLKGKKSATQLQTLLHNPSCGPHLVPELTLQILGSLTEALSHLNNCGSPQILADSAYSGDRKWKDSGKKSKEPAKARRGCYKRRKSSDSWTSESETKEDGLAWRKYGQKWILNSKYPRCYFRCTHKVSQGCKATKQVQRISEDKYMTIYFGHHTCKDSIRAPVLLIKSISDPYPMMMAVDSAHSQSFECITQDDDDDYNHDAIANQEDGEFKDQDTQTGVSQTKSSECNAWDNDQCMTSGSSGTSLDVDDSCFANLGNLLQSEEMRLLDY